VEKPSRLEVGGADPTKKLPECRPHVHFQKSGTSLNSKQKKSHLNVHARPPQQTRTSSPKVFAHSTTLYPSPTLPSPANEPRGQNTFDAVTTTVPSRRRTYQPRACYVIRKTESTESTFRNPKSSRQPPDPTFDHVPIHLVTSLEIEYTSRGYVMSSKAAMNRANEARLSWR
jgi:hypothetical protein